MSRVEPCAQFGLAAEVDLERLVRALVAQVRPALGVDRRRVDALALDLARRFGGDPSPAFVNGILDAVSRGASGAKK